MKDFFEGLLKAPFRVILLLVGSAFVLLGYFHPADVKSHFIVADPPTYVLVIFGAVLIAASLGSAIVAIMDASLSGLFRGVSLSESDGGIETRLGGATVRIAFGRIEKIAEPTAGSLVVLPADEFFHDDCVRDPRSALGAFVGAKFPQQGDAFLAAVRQRLHGPTTLCERPDGTSLPSYGVGKVALVDRALGYEWNILAASITSHRIGEGLRAEMSTVVEVTREIGCVMADHRYWSVHIPLLGAGHGNLRPAAALFALLLGVAEMVSHPSGHDIRKVNIIVFRDTDNSAPQLSKQTVRRIVRMAIGLYTEPKA